MGTPRTRPSAPGPRIARLAGRPLTVCELKILRPRNWNRFAVPNVMMIAGTRPKLINNPLIAPSAAPTRIEMSRASQKFIPPTVISLPIVTEHTMRMAATEMSMPAVTMMMVMPMAMIPIGARRHSSD